MASIASTGYAQRRYSAAPETGTITTSQPTAWVTSTNYVRDPTNGGINRVTNVGNLYQCRVDHTSSGANQPTTTSDTTQWAYLGAAPPAGNTAAGSLLLAVHAGRHDPMSVPTDNDSGTYTAIDTFAYASFTQWGMGLFRRGVANNKTGYTISTTWAGTSPGSGAGEEVTLFYIEIADVVVGAPHAKSHVERASPTGGTVTSTAITTTVPCLVLSIWGGSGNVITAGDSHVATPLGGLTLIPGATAKMAISADGYIQVACAFRIAQPGTFTESWTSNEGAQLFTAAWPLGTITGTGTATADDATASATGQVRVTGTGTATAADATASGDGTIDPPATTVTGGALGGLVAGIRCGIVS